LGVRQARPGLRNFGVEFPKFVPRDLFRELHGIEFGDVFKVFLTLGKGLDLAYQGHALVKQFVEFTLSVFDGIATDSDQRPHVEYSPHAMALSAIAVAIAAAVFGHRSEQTAKAPG
jgi:hypothetical protein